MMSRFVRLSVALCLAVLLTHAPAAAQPRAALITDVSGFVEVTRAGGGAAQRASWGMQLFNGDRISAGADGGASLLYTDNNLVALTANAELVIGSGGAATTSRPVGGSVVAMADLTLHRAGQGEIAALGGLRAGGGRKAIVPLTPRQTRIRDARPVFAWMAAGDYDEFRVSVTTATGSAVWSGTTGEAELAYPAEAPALAPGESYLWKVEGEAMLDVTASDLTPFELLPTDEGVTIAESESAIRESLGDGADTSSADFLLGSLYAEHGLLADAVAAFDRIAHRHPDSSVAQEILGRLYYDLGLKDEAIEALQKALSAKR